MKHRFALILCLCMLWDAATPAIGETAVEKTARTLYAQTGDADVLIEGFATAVSGMPLKYPNPLNMSERIPVRVAYANVENSTVEWQTAPVPADAKGKNVTMLWPAAIGCKWGSPKFDLYVNGTKRLTFTSADKPEWTVTGADGASLSFVTLALEPGNKKDRLGIMKLVVPAAWTTPGKPLDLKIVGEPADSKSWAMVYETPAGPRSVYYRIEPRNLGDIYAVIVARETWAGRPVMLRTGKNTVGPIKLTAENGLAVAKIKLTRRQQQDVGETVDVVVGDEVVGTVDLSDLRRQRLVAFLDEDLKFDPYVFPVGKFPEVYWKRPGMVDNEMGPFDLTVTFYDAAMNPVVKAEKPGRYGAVVSAKLPDGYTMERYVTLYAYDAKERFPWWDTEVKLKDVTIDPRLGVSPDVQKRFHEQIDDHFKWVVREGLFEEGGGAVLLAGISEMANTVPSDAPGWKKDPRLRDRQWWVTFKCKQAGVKTTPLERPIKEKKQIGTVLHKGDPASVGYSAEDIGKIRDICRRWAEDSGEPFNVLIARKGVIVLHESFGKKKDGTPITLDERTWMASITKLLTGTLMMEFVDQGLVDLDAPVTKYLPELKRGCENDTKLTVRHLFTHTNGFWDHGTWGCDWGSDFENHVGHYMPMLEVGKKLRYNGVGYAVAGKIMERITGKAIPYLFQEHLFGPLGATNTNIHGTAGDPESTCMDIGRVAQMLLNKGAYGNERFFSEQTFQKMMPIPLDKLVPELKTEWGIGAVWMKGNGLGEGTFGHGAASAAILCIDPPHDLVIVQCRNNGGPKYKEYHPKFIEAVIAPLAEKTEEE